MRFQGKAAAWFYGVLLLVAAVCLPLLVVSIWVEPSLFGGVTILLVFLLTETLGLSIVFRNYVALGDEGLLIVFGFIRKRIPYAAIIDFSETRDPASSLAASLDRIRITLKSGGDVLISVRDKAAFLGALKSRVGAAPEASKT